MDRKKRVFITGCNGGIGADLCLLFKKKGWFVIGTDLQQTNLTEVDHYEQINLIEINNEESIIKLNELKNNLLKNGLNCLINNAATQTLDSFVNLEQQDFINSMTVNFIAPVALVKFFIDKLMITKGQIINISSIHTKLTKKNFSAYAASKSAMDSLTRSLAIEFGSNLKVNGIRPAAIYTDMLLSGFNNNEEKIDELAKYHPAKTIGKSKTVAEIAYVLTKSDDLFLNGSIVDIDGGISYVLHDPD